LSFERSESKASADICVIGDLDELNSYLGLIRSKTKSQKDKIIVERMQRALTKIVLEITVGTEKKTKLGALLTKDDADWIKNVVRRLEKRAKLESCFILPGEGEFSAFLDIARAVARRAERSVVGLLQEEKVKNDNILSYLNCISDILFIMAREKPHTRGERKKDAR
ncbi:MAG: cob(I)yrinic acid a,c-diamide adenosyltransferase, partial [Candidatus Omnitrophota bacterium]